MTVSEELEWRVLIVERQKHELCMELLGRQPIELFNPLYQPAKRDKANHADLREKPLFPGYIFARFEWRNHTEPLLVTGVQRILSFRDGPATVQPEEIDRLRLILQSDEPITATERLVHGQKVVVVLGPLVGLTGELLSSKGSEFIVVNLPMLGRSCATKMRRDMVRAV